MAGGLVMSSSLRSMAAADSPRLARENLRARLREERHRHAQARELND